MSALKQWAQQWAQLRLGGMGQAIAALIMEERSLSVDDHVAVKKSS